MHANAQSSPSALQSLVDDVEGPRTVDRRNRCRAAGYDGWRSGVEFQADAAALRARRIVAVMLAKEAGRSAHPSWPGRRNVISRAASHRQSNRRKQRNDNHTRTSADIDLAKVDLTALRYFEDGPPYALFARMRAEASPHWNALTGDEPGFWSFTKAADIAAISRDPGHVLVVSRRGVHDRRRARFRPRCWRKSSSAWTRRATPSTAMSCRLSSLPS